MLFYFGDLAIEEANGPLALGVEPAVGDLMADGFFRRRGWPPSDPGPPAGRRGAEGGRLGGGGSGSVRRPLIGQHPGVEAVGFGENATGAGKVAHLAGIDDADGQAALVAMSHEGALIAAGGFAHEMDGGSGKGL